MTKKFDISINNDKNQTVAVKCPYHPEFVKRIKGIGKAKWNGHCWVIPEINVPEVRQLMIDIYGENDIEIPNYFKVRATTKKRIINGNLSVTLMGKTLCTAYGRDSGAKIHDDVMVVAGSVNSGGSIRNPEIIVQEGTVFVVANVSSVMYERCLETESKLFDIEVVNDPRTNRSSLLAEREQLLARLAVIDAELAQI